MISYLNEVYFRRRADSLAVTSNGRDCYSTTLAPNGTFLLQRNSLGSVDCCTSGNERASALMGPLGVTGLKDKSAPRTAQNVKQTNKQNPGASSSEGDYTHPHLNCLGDNYVNSFFPQSICYTCLQLSIKINWMIDGLKTQDIRLHYKIISFLSTVKLRVTTLAI